MRAYQLPNRAGDIVGSLEDGAPLLFWADRSLLGAGAKRVWASAIDDEMSAQSASVHSWWWSGSLAELDPPDESEDSERREAGSATDDRLFVADPRTWGPRGWAALAETLKSTVPTRESPVFIRPHARHVVSDLPGISRVLREHPNVEVIADPASMLTPEMAGGRDGKDHLTRLVEGLVSPALARPIRGMVLAQAGVDGPTSLLTPIGPGALLDAALIRMLARELLPPEMPIILVGPDAVSQRSWLLA